MRNKMPNTNFFMFTPKELKLKDLNPIQILEGLLLSELQNGSLIGKDKVALSINKDYRCNN
jgi:hypothetical protein